mmetsp:Transcript_68620/g.100471  ORF Transcript_68620/g.100471 Transcript_68620/m.100471 type:complete len:453 (+) Transcript_68620:78-1436(+)
MDGHDDHSAAQDEDPDDGIRVFPRRKLHEAEHGKVYSEPVRGRPPMTLSLKTVELLFDLPQKDVAARFGISLTAFKQVCRKLGITRWPYRRASKALAPEASPDPDEFDPEGQNNASPSETGGLLSHQSRTASSLTQDHADDSKSVVPPPPSSPLSSPHSGILPMPSLGLGRASLSGPSKRQVVGRAELPHSMQAPDSFPFLDLIGPAFDFDMPFLQTQPSLNTHPGSNIQTDKGRKWGGHISGCMGTRAADSNSVFGEEFDVMTASNQCQPTLFLAAPLMPTHVSNHHADNKDNVEASFEPVRKDAKVQQHSVMLNTQKASFARVIQADTHHDQPMSTQTMHAHTLNQSHTPRLRLNMQEHALSSMKHGAVQAATNLNSKQPHIEVASPLYNLHIAELEGSEPQLSSRHLGTTINTSFMTPLVSISETLEKNEDATAPLPLAPFDDDKAVVS